jgi:hypothetical protein
MSEQIDDTEAASASAPGTEEAEGQQSFAEENSVEASAETSEVAAGEADGSEPKNELPPAISPRLVAAFADALGRHGLGQALGYLGSRRDRRYQPLAQKFSAKLAERLRATGAAIEPSEPDCATLIGWIGTVDGPTYLAATVEASAALSEIYRELQSGS